MRKKLMTVLLAGLGFAFMSGCYESTDVTLFSPGVYKGPVDPLLEKQASAGQQSALKERFNLVQTDR